MSRAKVGDRVGAIASMTKDEVKLFGFGVYQGDEVPPRDVMGPFGYVSIRNPKILLDGGDVVWGCECWWGPEERVKEAIGERPVVPITPAEYRARAAHD